MPPARIPLEGVPITWQPTVNTCVPACLNMLLDELSPGRAATIIESLQLAPRGMMPADMIAFIDDNLSALGFRTVRGDLAQALESGQPFIAVIDDGHAVLVQGREVMSGAECVVVRDPSQGAYLEPLTDFDARLVRDGRVLAHPTIWGERALT